MKWIVGLGNPGKKYERTRHNIGFMVLEQLAEQQGWRWTSNAKCRAETAEGFVEGKKLVLIKPMTYMNLSGEAVRRFVEYYKADVEEMIVVYDDLDTPFGKIRLRYKGSAGGHNGIKSIIEQIGTQTFNRIRVGISRPEPDLSVVDYVLSDFSKEEAKSLPHVLNQCCEAILFSLDQPFEKTMA